MAQQLITTSRDILARILPVLESIEGNSLQYEESLAALQGIYDISPVDDLEDSSLDDGSYRNLFHLLATCLKDARTQESANLGEALGILADASRELKWRRYLGKCESYSTEAGWPPDPKHDSYGCSHEQWSSHESECVLQVAVRTLHPRHVKRLGQAGYHALRLISNCCADNDANKRVVLECGGIDLLLRCANMKLWPDIVIAALWNICAESEVQAPIESESAIIDDTPPEESRNDPGLGMSDIACTQLALRSNGECDDSAGKSLLAAEFEDARRHTNVIKELLDLADMVKRRAWKEMLAELLEKASWSISRIYEASPTVGTKRILPMATRLSVPDLRPSDFLAELLTGSGRRLALSSPECSCDVSRTVAILLSQHDIQQELIHEDLVRPFLEVPNWGNANLKDNEPTRPDVPKALLMVRQSLYKIIYEVSASSEFAARYGNGAECPQLVSACIEALGDVSNLRHTQKADNMIPAASACVVLANLTQSEDFALFLVQQKSIHRSLGLILRQRDDTNTLFPAIALLDRLAIPPENKITLFSAGLVYELPRFLIGFDIQPRIQCEAVSIMRKIVVGQPGHVSGIGICVPLGSEEHIQGQRLERSQQQSGLLAALSLFRRVNDAEVKIEIGRLVVEVCRTLLRSTKGRPESAENAVRQAFGSANGIAHPIAHLTCNGTSQESRGEGWFGLAVLSTWEHGRPFVMDCLNVKTMQDAMEEALKAGVHAVCQNMTLMLTNLRRFPSQLVSSTTRDVLERAACDMGLSPIWPILAPAA